MNEHAISDEELDELVEATLVDVGVHLEALREQALRGRFDSERLRRVWFVIRGLGRG